MHNERPPFGPNGVSGVHGYRAEFSVHSYALTVHTWMHVGLCALLHRRPWFKLGPRLGRGRCGWGRPRRDRSVKYSDVRVAIGNFIYLFFFSFFITRDSLAALANYEKEAWMSSRKIYFLRGELNPTDESGRVFVDLGKLMKDLYTEILFGGS